MDDTLYDLVTGNIDGFLSFWSDIFQLVSGIPKLNVPA